MLTCDPFQVSATLRLHEEEMSNGPMKTIIHIFFHYFIRRLQATSLFCWGPKSWITDEKLKSHEWSMCYLRNITFDRNNSALRFWQCSEFVLLATTFFSMFIILVIFLHHKNDQMQTMSNVAWQAKRPEHTVTGELILSKASPQQCGLASIGQLIILISIKIQWDW